MQLKSRRRKAPIVASLGLAVANLLAAGAAQAQSDVQSQIQGQDQTGAASAPSIMTEPASGVGTTTADTAILFYQEQGGRVRAIEPTGNLTVNLDNGDVFTGSVTYDSLTGATPNGALPAARDQTFTLTIPVTTSTQTTSTGASGQTVVTTVNGTSTAQRSYTTPAYALPVDAGFKDHRIAGSLGYTMQATPNLRAKFGGAVSVERDYDSYSVNVGFSRDFDEKNTTLSLDLNFEQDRSHPFFGTPSGLAPIGQLITGGNDNKTVVSLVAGITQTITPRWLMQLNYSYGTNQGYQSDPYKFLSVIDPTNGYALDYRYENRPRSRIRQSVYFGNKIALGPTVADLSFRYYHDSWGIDAITAEASERIGITHAVYIEPTVRYYHQSAANFFRYYLDYGTALPTYASADSRLGRFNALTLGAKAGVRLTDSIEFWVAGEDYKQTGTHTLANAPGALSSVDVFGGVHALSIMSGLHFKL